MQDHKPARKKQTSVGRSRVVSKKRSVKKDFVSSLRKKTKPSAHYKTRTKSKSKKNFGFLMAIFVIIVFLISAMFVLGMILPHFFPLNENKTIFISPDLKNNSARAYLLNFNVEDEHTSIISLNSGLTKQVLGGYGEYKIGSIYSLLKMDGKDDGFIRSAISLALETIIDDVVVVQNNSNLVNKHDVEKIFLTMAWENFWKINKFYEYFSNYIFVKNSSFEFFQNDDLDLSTKERTAIQNSGEKVCPVAVLNTTSTQGLASKINRVLSNDGMNIIRVDSDSSNQIEKTEIYFDESIKNCDELVERVLKILPNYQPIKNTDKTNQYRAGIVILLGKDFVY